MAEKEISGVIHGMAMVTGRLTLRPLPTQLVLEVELQEPDTIVVPDQEVIDVELEEADFDVKVIEKITTITKE